MTFKDFLRSDRSVNTSQSLGHCRSCGDSR
jgi:hypothetical protein